MPPQHVINVDLAEVVDASTKGKFVRMLAWGDDVEVLNTTADHLEVRTFRFEQSESDERPSRYRPRDS
jgi:hypothetical protein